MVTSIAQYKRAVSQHFIWIELIETKEAKVVADAFVNRVLLEEGAPRAVLTDNGTEFKNKFLCNMMEHLQVDHQFSPPYHPQSNQTERANRFIVETLRTMVNEPGARKRDWSKPRCNNMPLRRRQFGVCRALFALALREGGRTAGFWCGQPWQQCPDAWLGWSSEVTDRWMLAI